MSPMHLKIGTTLYNWKSTHKFIRLNITNTIGYVSLQISSRCCHKIRRGQILWARRSLTTEYNAVTKHTLNCWYADSSSMHCCSILLKQQSSLSLLPSIVQSMVQKYHRYTAQNSLYFQKTLNQLCNYALLHTERQLFITKTYYKRNYATSMKNVLLVCFLCLSATKAVNYSQKSTRFSVS